MPKPSFRDRFTGRFTESFRHSTPLLSFVMPTPSSLSILAAILGDRKETIEFVLIVGAPGSGGTSRVTALDYACFEGDNGGRLAPIVCIDVSALADEHREAGTALGKIFDAMHAHRKAGGMYQDWPVLLMMADKIHSSHVGPGTIKAVIRGLPRSEGQTEEILRLIELGFKVTLMEFDVNASQRRLNLTRRAGEGRADDAPEVYAKRVAEYDRTLPFVHRIRDYLIANGFGRQYHYHTTPAEGASIEGDMRLIIGQLGLGAATVQALMDRLFDETTKAGKFFMPKHSQDVEQAHLHAAAAA